MRNIATLFLCIFLFGALPGQKTKNNYSISEEKEEIRELLIDVMKWHDKIDPFIGYEPTFDPKSEQATGLDLRVLQEGLDELKETEFFDATFLANYRTKARSVHTQIQNKEMEFMDGDLPPYAEVDPWCNCQDVPMDFSWDQMHINFINLDKNLAELTWTWDDSEESQSFAYGVKLRKMRGKWRITYLQGFDANNIKK